MSEQPIEDRTPKMSKAKASSGFAQRELDKAEAQFDKFDQEIKEMTMDRMNQAPRQESEAPKMAEKDIHKNNDLYLKPKRTIFAVDTKTGQGQKFNENFRAEYNFQKEYVNFMFTNNELSGETTTIWTRPFGGLPAEEWEVPPNKPVWGPRYLAEQIKRCFYHRLVMRDRVTSGDGVGQWYGSMAADTTVQRLDAHPVSSRKSVFMGASGF